MSLFGRIMARGGYPYRDPARVHAEPGPVSRKLPDPDGPDPLVFGPPGSGGLQTPCPPDDR